jgi:hypothetical protein
VEELDVRPTLGAVEPSDRQARRDSDPVEALMSSSSAVNGYSPNGSRFGFPHLIVVTLRARPCSSTCGSLHTLFAPRARHRRDYSRECSRDHGRNRSGQTRVFVQLSRRLVIRGGGLNGEDRDRRPAVVAAVHAIRAVASVRSVVSGRPGVPFGAVSRLGSGRARGWGPS